MDLSPHVASIEDSLLAAAAAGDDGTRRAAAALSAALEPAVRLAIMNALAESAVDITDALGDRVVEVRLDGGDVRVVVSPLPDVDGEEATQLADTSGVLSRITLRLPDELKIEAERTAALHGVSLNTWLARAVREALRAEATGPKKQQGQHEGTHRVRGWVQG
jgi:hypothetical protein